MGLPLKEDVAKIGDSHKELCQQLIQSIARVPANPHLSDAYLRPMGRPARNEGGFFTTVKTHHPHFQTNLHIIEQPCEYQQVGFRGIPDDELTQTALSNPHTTSRLEALESTSDWL